MPLQTISHIEGLKKVQNAARQAGIMPVRIKRAGKTQMFAIYGNEDVTEHEAEKLGKDWANKLRAAGLHVQQHSYTFKGGILYCPYVLVSLPAGTTVRQQGDYSKQAVAKAIVIKGV